MAVELTTSSTWLPFTTSSATLLSTIIEQDGSKTTDTTLSLTTLYYPSVTTISSSSGSSSSSSSSSGSSSSTITSPSVSGATPTSTTSSTSSSSTTSSSSSPSPTGIHSTNSKGVSTSTVAGVGVGAAFAGAFLAILIIWIFLRRSRSSQRGGENSWLSEANHEGNFGGKEKGNSIGKGLSNSIVASEDIPLDPADDSQIRKSMQDLYELIHQHVENHYSARNFQGRNEDLKAELVKCGWSDRTEPSAQTLTSLLIHPVTRRVAIRHIIAWFILQHVDVKSNPETSLLPPHILASGQAMLKIKRTPGEQQAFSNAFTKWRHLTASLLSPLSSQPDNLESDSNVRPAVTRNVKLLNSILQPFIKSGTETQIAQSDNLASIILEGAHFGLVMFAQPAVWIFGWDGKNTNQGGRSRRRSGAGNGGENKLLVIFPSIAKMIVRDGSEQLRVVSDVMLERV